MTPNVNSGVMRKHNRSGNPGAFVHIRAIQVTAIHSPSASNTGQKIISSASLQAGTMM